MEKRVDRRKKWHQSNSSGVVGTSPTLFAEKIFTTPSITAPILVAIKKSILIVIRELPNARVKALF
jgi:hypothetical protein